mmetsp:Transcript_27382/g.58429  ORF Transcript_27382/g.58429 Transcript_27382/m.58429 type:complete len:144 (-) Transcript_27382:275-706(-)
MRNFSKHPKPPLVCLPPLQPHPQSLPPKTQLSLASTGFDRLWFRFSTKFLTPPKLLKERLLRNWTERRTKKHNTGSKNTGNRNENIQVKQAIYLDSHGDDFDDFIGTSMHRKTSVCLRLPRKSVTPVLAYKFSRRCHCSDLEK